MPLQHYPHPDGLYKPPTYSHTVMAAGRLVVISGQVALDENGGLVGAGDLAAQAEQVMRNVGLALAAAGAGYADIVKLTTYVVGYRPEHRPILGQARAPYFAGGPLPAHTLIGVQALADPAWLVEIEAMAALP